MTYPVRGQDFVVGAICQANGSRFPATYLLLGHGMNMGLFRVPYAPNTGMCEWVDIDFDWIFQAGPIQYPNTFGYRIHIPDHPALIGVTFYHQQLMVSGPWMGTAGVYSSQIQ